MQIMIVLMVPHHLTTTNYLSRWYRYAKWVQLCIKKFKISIFDQFFWFWVLECDVYDGYWWDEMRWVYMSSYEMSSHEMSSRGWLSWPVKLLPILSGRWWDPCRLRQVTVLTNGEPTAENVRVCVCVSTSQLSYFLPHDFANFWSEVRGQNSKTPDRAGLSKKNLDHSIITNMCFDT